MARGSQLFTATVIQLGRVSYALPDQPGELLSGVDLDVAAGEWVQLEGPTGSGKSTLLSLLALLEVPTEGDYVLNGRSVLNLTRVERARIRWRELGLVRETPDIDESLPAFENVALPLMLRDMDPGKIVDLVFDAMRKVGLHQKAMHPSADLTPGEQQRLAMARAVVGGPSVLLLKDPTTNLDLWEGETVMQALEHLHESGETIVLSTHDTRFTCPATRRVNFLEGRMVGETAEPL